MAQFFDYPINFYNDTSRNKSGETVIAAFGDGRRDTFSDETTYRFLTHDVNATPSVRAATRISHIYVRGKNIATYRVSVPTGFGTGTPATRTMPTSLQNPEGRTISIVREGVAADLFALPTPFSATAVDMTLTGTDIEVYSVLILNEVLAMDSDTHFIQMRATLEQHTSAHFQNVRGQRFRYSIAPEQSWKWGVAYGARFIGDADYTALLEFMQQHQHFAFAEDYTRYPQRVYPATFKNYGVTLEFITRWKGSGTDIYFEIAEI